MTSFDALLEDDLASAVATYLERHPERTVVEPADLAIAILESASTGRSQHLPERAKRFGLDIDEALSRLAALIGEAPPAEPGPTTEEPFSATVRSVRDELASHSEVTAGEVAAAIAARHPEYAGKQLGGVAWPDPPAGIRRPVDEWLARVANLYDVEAVRSSTHRVLDGRLVLLGLAEEDDDVVQVLEEAKLRAALLAEVEVRPRTVRRTSTLRMLADRPVTEESQDLLGFGPHVTAVAQMVTSPETSTPLAIAVTGPWGSGKSSLMRMVEDRVRRTAPGPPVFIWFNAWAHDDADNLGLALAARVTADLAGARPLAARILHPTPRELLRGRARYVNTVVRGAVVVAAVALLAWVFRDLILDPSVQTSLAERWGWVGGVLFFAWLVLQAWGHFLGVAQAVGRFVTSPRSEANTGELHEVSRELGELIAGILERGGGRRLVVVVDDLERCEPPRSIEVCEVAHQLLDHPGVIVVYLADMRSIAVAAEIKYEELARRLSGLPAEAAPGADASWGRSYIEKIIQFQIHMPVPSPAAIRRFIAAGTPRIPDAPTQRTAAPADSDRAAEQAKTALEEGATPSQVQRSLEDRGVERRQVEQVVAEAIVSGDSRFLRAAESRILDHAPANPRHIKRLLNRLRYLLVVFGSQGLLDAEPYETAQLVGKWCVLSERWPEVTHGARTDADLVPDLERLAVGEGALEAVRRRLAGAGLHAAEPARLVELLAVEPRFEDRIGWFRGDWVASAPAVPAVS